ncbi:MAG: methyltransferase domain-containing protein [Chthoniobacteraceae bacterium]|nr:methyltransferase domain-containing protein [Chthoniobacteraceae bacterium]
MKYPAPLAPEDTPQAIALGQRMEQYYQTEPGYAAFTHVNNLPEQWKHIRAAILAVLRKQPQCRVLEVGAGRSGFPSYMADHRASLHYTAQDITQCNADYLAAIADAVHFGRVSAMEDQHFDIIFSTFVFEHESTPRRSLEKLFGMLEPEGSLFLFCPRYDMPLYLPHSADHYSAARRMAITLFLLGARLWTRLSGRPMFFIHTDPALFHLPWGRDRDAIHWVSLGDVRALFRHRGRVERLRLASGGIKDSIVKNLLQLNIRVTRRA